jgi:hypothetical protein
MEVNRVTSSSAPEEEDRPAALKDEPLPQQARQIASGLRKVEQDVANIGGVTP